MATQVQQRRGTTAEHSTFTGAVGEVTIDTDKDTVVVHDGATAGGRPLLREDGSNSALALGSAATPSLKFTGDTNTGIYSPGADQLALSTNGTGRLTIDGSGNINVDSGGLYYDATTNRLAIGTTSPGAALQVNGVAQFGATGQDGVIQLVRSSDGGAVASLGFISGTTEVKLNNALSGPTTFYTNNTERARIDSSGRLLVGTSTARTNLFGVGISATTQVESSSPISSVIRNDNSNSGAYLLLGKSRSTGNTIVQNDDVIGVMSFQGNDGTNFLESAYVAAFVDGTPGANDMPGRLVFSTTADGASSPTERFRIMQNGMSSFYNTGFVIPNTDNAVALGGGTNRWSAVYAVNGTIQTSDARAKTAVADSSLGSDFVKALRPVSYKWIEGGQRHTGEYDDEGNFVYETTPGARTHWGFIAQEVKEAVDAAGVDFGGWVLTDKDDPESQQALRYDQFIAPLTKALQEALAKIEQLEQRLADAGI